MANRRVLVKRRKSVRNIRKITRTMQLIATARFKTAFNRAVASRPYTEKLAELVGRPGARRRRARPSAAARPGTRRTGGGARADLQPRPVRRLQLERPAHRAGLPRRAPAGAAPSEVSRPSARRASAYFRFISMAFAAAGVRDQRPAALRAGRAAGQHAHPALPGRRDLRGPRRLHAVLLGRQAAARDDPAPAARPRPPRRSAPRASKREGGRLRVLARARSTPRRPAACRRPSCRLFQAFLDAAVSEQIARMVGDEGRHRRRRRDDQEPDAASTTGRARRRSPWNCSRSWAAPTRSPDAVAERHSRTRNDSQRKAERHGQPQRRQDHPGHRLDVRRGVPRGQLPRIYNALTVEVERPCSARR